MRRLLVIPLAMLALLMGALAWSGGGVRKRADFAFINRGDIITLDLNQMSYMQDFRLSYSIREGLYSYDPATLRPIPAGAATVDLSADKRVWTFHLRPEARWSNGDPVTAADYVFSWRRMLEEPGEYTYLFYYVTNAKAYEKAYADRKPFDLGTLGVKAVDPLTLRVELTDPVPYLPDLLAFPPFYPRHEPSMRPFLRTLDGGRTVYDAAYTRPPAVVTNGPYDLTRWDFAVRLVLTKSPTYWDKANVPTETIEMVVCENPLTQFLRYEAGEVDWLADVKGDQAAELRAKGRTDLYSSPAFGTAFLTLLCRDTLPPSSGVAGKNPLADVRVRQALALTIDRNFITEYITRMGELPARTYLPPDGTLADFRWLPGILDPAGPGRPPYADVELRKMLPDTKNPSGPGLGFDVAAARKLLADAGYPGGAGFPVLPVLFNSENSTRGKFAQAIKDQWKANLGITVDVQQVEGKVFKQRVSKKDYVIATAAWYGDYPDASTFTDKYLSDSLQNDSDWQNKAFDALCAKAAKETDAAARVALLSQAEHLIDTEVPIIPLYHYTNVSMNRPYVEGIAPNPRNTTIFKGLRVKKH
jgi:oligopeptide transport system substrate-binding protein